jgi:hypothetical protein
MNETIRDSFVQDGFSHTHLNNLIIENAIDDIFYDEINDKLFNNGGV